MDESFAHPLCQAKLRVEQKSKNVLVTFLLLAIIVGRSLSHSSDKSKSKAILDIVSETFLLCFEEL